MVIKKLLSANVGSHYPEQALILTEAGEFFVTSDTLEPEGYELVRFFDLGLLNTRINALLRGVQGNGQADAVPDDEKVSVSAIANLYRLTGYASGTVLDNLEGGYQSQTVTVVGDGVLLTVKSTGNLRLKEDFTTSDPYSAIVLQKTGEVWVEISRSLNT